MLVTSARRRTPTFVASRRVCYIYYIYIYYAIIIMRYMWQLIYYIMRYIILCSYMQLQRDLHQLPAYGRRIRRGVHCLRRC